MPLLMALIALAGLAGCSFRRVVVNDPISPADITFIVPDQTTRAAVVSRLGAPQEITSTADRDVFRYRYSVQKTFHISFGQLTRGFVPVSISRGRTGLDVFEVQFDARGLVQAFSFKLRARAAPFNPWPF
jgi:hypothetical protein